MQRWIAVAVLLMMLMLGGGAFAYWNHKQNAPAPMWVPLSIRSDLGNEERDQTIRKLREELMAKEVLMQVSKDLGLAKKWNLASVDDAEHELARRVFVKLGDMNSPNGRVPAVHIGVTGPNKEKQLSGEIAMRLMDDVRRILGIMPELGE